MEKIGIDVHKVASQVCIRTDARTFVEQRIATTREAFAKHLGGHARAHILLEASTESEWVARCLEALGHEVIVADPNFARFRCDACHAERLVPFSCKARAVCPSCGGRRMAERAAHLVDRVLPAVPIRQWVPSLPFRLRYVLAFDHALCRKVLAVHVRALRAFYRRRARREAITDGETGAVTAVQQPRMAREQA